VQVGRVQLLELQQSRLSCDLPCQKKGELEMSEKSLTWKGLVATAKTGLKSIDKSKIAMMVRKTIQYKVGVKIESGFLWA
jgi:hypothetical protein